MKYPIGIQSFEKIRLGEYTYVDKTALIHQLVNTSNYYFLSRPRRFGKSLLISTLEAYFNGQQELFKGLEMERLEKEWTKYPVLHLDLNTSKYDEKNSLIDILNDTLCQWENIYGAVSSEVNPELRFKGIIRRAYEQGVSDYISRPFDAKVVYRRVYNTIKLYAKQRRLVSMVTSQILEKEKNNMLLINILSHVVEFRNGQNGSHVQHMRQLSERLLEMLCAKTDRYRLTPQDCDLIALASSMHDIGKIAIDAKILNKPGKLTPEEFEQMKQHTILGAKMLDDLAAHHNEKLVGTACDICRWHHERYDGHGYPDGLVGDEIPISAQVVSLADVYDTLISERVYKPAYSHEQAMAMILNGECGVFNPLLIECLKELRETLRCELDVPPLNVKREKAPGDGAKPAESEA